MHFYMLTSLPPVSKRIKKLLLTNKKCNNKEQNCIILQIKTNSYTHRIFKVK